MGLHNGWWAAIFLTTSCIYEYHKVYPQDCNQQEIVIYALQMAKFCKNM